MMPTLYAERRAQRPAHDLAGHRRHGPKREEPRNAALLEGEAEGEVEDRAARAADEGVSGLSLPYHMIQMRQRRSERGRQRCATTRSRSHESRSSQSVCSG